MRRLACLLGFHRQNFGVDLAPCKHCGKPWVPAETWTTPSPFMVFLLAAIVPYSIAALPWWVTLGFAFGLFGELVPLYTARLRQGRGIR